MAHYVFAQWEHNGRDDSDWYAVVYNDETDELKCIETGTTRFANALHIGPPLLPPTDEIREKAIIKLRDRYIRMVKRGNELKVLEPGPEDMRDGLRIRFLEPHKCMAKEYDETPCKKCNGSGKWVNPRNSSDKRDCFTCKGQGIVKTNFRRKKDDAAKQEWLRIDSGSTGVIIRATTYGTFYANGYNRPDRHNTTAIIKLDDGREVKAPLKKLRLDAELMSDEECFKRADSIARSGENAFYMPFRTAGPPMLYI